MRRVPNVLLCGVILFAGCAGRQANPIAIKFATDDQKTLLDLHNELEDLAGRQFQAEKSSQYTQADNFRNVILGGMFIVPWFFLDLQDADRIEAAAYQRRIDYLQLLFMEKAMTAGKSAAKP